MVPLSLKLMEPMYLVVHVMLAEFTLLEGGQVEEDEEVE